MPPNRYPAKPRFCGHEQASDGKGKGEGGTKPGHRVSELMLLIGEPGRNPFQDLGRDIAGIAVFGG